MLWGMSNHQDGKVLLKIILVVLLIIIILLLSFVIYIYINLKPFLSSGDSSDIAGNSNVNVASGASNNDKHPLLNDQQENLLETFGVDVTKLPTEITPAMEACFTEKLGIERVKEIKAGESPGALDFFKAKSCITD